MQCLSKGCDVQRVQRGLSDQACMTSLRQDRGKGTEGPGCECCREHCCIYTVVMSEHYQACMFRACCMLPIGCTDLYMQVWACAIEIILSGHQLLQKGMQGSVLCLVELGNVVKDLTVYGSHDTIFQGNCCFGPLCKTNPFLLFWRVCKKAGVATYSV